MFIERLKEKFNTSEPIFTEEVLELFPDFSRAQVFRFIKKARDNNEIVQYDKGVYYIPRKTFLGYSSISADTVIEKRYLRNEENIYGVYSGIKLFNKFSMTTQMAAVIEIVTNNESAKYREIQIKNRRFILRRSRCKINKDNAAAYTVLQLFSEFDKKDKLNENAKRRLIEYMRVTGVTKEQLFSLSMRFPSKTVKNLIGSGVLNEVA
ncbi:MAG: hypothetical protein IJ706_02730 [Clostridia bacterium]|nr:hypothetical protein [Clostridia bacterium]